MTRPLLPSLESLKREAKALKKTEGCLLSDAQRKIAKRYGFVEWNLLHRHHPETQAKKPASAQATPEEMRQWFLANHEVEISDPFDEDEVLLPTVDANHVLRQQFPAALRGRIEEVAEILEEEGPWVSLGVKNAITWFMENHERAVESTPYESREGGYQYPLVDILDAVCSKFPDLPEDELTQAVEAIEGYDSAWVDAGIFMAIDDDGFEDFERDE